MTSRRPAPSPGGVRNRARHRHDVTRVLLDNGLAVVLVPRDHLSQAYVGVFFGVGSRDESLADNGLTHVLEHMLFRGTERFADATTLNEAVEDLGGVLEGATYRDHVVFATGCHPSGVSEAIELLAEMVQAPRYRGIEIERSILREELLETLDADGRMVDLDNIAHAATFPRHGLGPPIEGTLANVEAFDRERLEAHRRRHFGAHNAVVVVAGAFDAGRVAAQVRHAFAAMPAGEAPVSPMPPPPQARPVLRYVRDASSQVDIRLSFRAAAAYRPDYPALVTLSRLLTDGLASRMHAELIDRRGLAYSLHAGLTTYSDCGLFEFDVAVAPDRAAEVVAAILAFGSGAGRLRYGKDELARARRRFRYAMEFMDDAPAELAGWHGRSTLFGVEAHMRRLERKLMQVEAGAVRAAARETFRPEGLVVAAVGELARGEWRRMKDAVDAWC